MGVILGILFFILAIPLGAFAGKVTIGLEWDANVETFLAGYKAYVADKAGGPYTEFADIKEPTTEVDYIYDAPDGQTVSKFFVVTAYRENPFLESGNSNEVFWTYDFSPIVAASGFAATLAGDNINFVWAQADIERVKSWRLYYKEAGAAAFVELALIPYSGTQGTQYSTTQEMIVEAGQIKTYVFAIVTYTPTGVFSPNSAEVTVVIDKRELPPVMNLTIKIKAQ